MKNILILLLACLGATANAEVIRADFKATTDLPYCQSCQSWREGPATRQALGRAVGDGLELDDTAQVLNPSAYSGGIVHIDLDPAAKTLTLYSLDEYDFEYFAVSISNILFDRGEIITGLSLVSDALTADFAVTPFLSFGRNHLSIEYDSPLGFYFTGGTAVFAYTTEERRAVPEPATLGLLALGLAGLIPRRRKG